MKKLPTYVVKIPGRGGRGVKVGHFILTAAHCVNFSTEGSMALGGYDFVEKIVTSHGQILAQPIFLDPISDIAVLGPLDNQECSGYFEEYLEWCQNTEGLQLAKITPTVKDFPVKVLGLNGKWINGQAGLPNGWNHRMFVDTREEIQGGCSGGPILNEDGLVAIVSHSMNQRCEPEELTGLHPYPWRALPQTFLRSLTIKDANEIQW